MDKEKRFLLEALQSEKRTLLSNLITKEIDMAENSKSLEMSERARKEGNKLYLQKGHDTEVHKQIFNYYSQSVAFAPINSEELAIAYGNKSAFLLHIKRYKESIEDIERALSITKSELLKIKLLCRQVKCLKALGSSAFESILKEAENLAIKIEGNDENKKPIEDLINDVKVLSISKKNSGVKRGIRFNESSASLDNVAIKCDGKYGRYLVATKDYAPGDIIFAEKFYVAVINSNLAHTHCSYCLNTCWSSIPCDQCNWAIFCSEQCKKQAWKTFHSVECLVTPFLHSNLPDSLTRTIKKSLRLLLLGLEEAGSIDKLREIFMTVDSCKDPISTGFYKNGQFLSHTISSVYCLSCGNFPDYIYKDISSTSIIVLIGLIKSKKVMKNVNLSTIDDIVKNEDLMFLASALTKLSLISTNNGHSYSQNFCSCRPSNNLKVREPRNLCCERGIGLAVLASLINHSCIANASRCFTEDGRIIVYALQPIKKNCQIFNSYCETFYSATLKDRKKIMEKYGFTCECQACVELWPPLLITPQNQLGKYQKMSTFEIKLYKDCISIFAALENSSTQFDKDDVKKLCKTISQAFRSGQPSLLLMSYLLGALNQVFPNVYGLKPPSFESCF